MANSQKGKREQQTFSSFVFPNFLFLKASGTLRKVFESNAVAWANRRAYGHLAAVLPMNRYSVHHSPPETGKTGQLNSDLKMRDSHAPFVLLKPGNERHPWFVDTLVRENLLASPKHFDPRRVFRIADDSTKAVLVRVWEYAKEFLADYVDAEHLRYRRKKINGESYASLPDLGQLLSGAGVERFANALRQGALKAKIEGPVVTYMEIAVALTRMSDPDGAPIHRLEARNPVWLWTPDGLKNPLRKPTHPIYQTDDFFCIPHQTSGPISANYRHYLTTHSARREIMGEAIKWAAAGANRGAAVYDFKTVQAAQCKPCQNKQPDEKKDFRLVQLVGGDLVVKDRVINSIGKVNIIKKSPMDPATDLAEYFRAFAMEFDFGRREYGRTIYEAADGAIYPSIDVRDVDTRIDVMGMFHSWNVAKALDARYTHAMGLCLNDGYYDDAYTEHEARSNYGFVRNFARHPILDRMDNDKPLTSAEQVRHIADYYFDTIYSDEPCRQVRAAKQISKERRRDYTRLELPGQFDDQIEQMQDGIPKPEELYTIVPIGSASSSLKPLGKDVYAYTRFAAERGHAMVWGGGNDKIMGYMEKGHRDGHGPWRCAVSTHRIIQEESITGHIPDHVHYWQLSRNIADRLQGLFIGITHRADGRRIHDGADFVPVYDGGSGTGQETCLLLGLGRRMPGFMDNRYLCFYNPPYSQMDHTIRAIFGSDNLALIKKDHEALADRYHVLMATTGPELQRRTLECETLKARNTAHLRLAVA